MNKGKESKIKMRKTSTQKGITLVALIITIVVLMILAAVAISSITNEGILNHANNAVVGFNEQKVHENTTLDSYEGVLDKWANGLANKSFTPYNIGNIVKVEDKNGNEHEFYVIAESDESQSEVTLMAKKCINTETLLQADADCVAFSSTNYWAEDESVWPDLNQLTVPEDETSIVTTAKEYGERFDGATGRLLTEKEARDLVPTTGAEDYDEKHAMIYGDSTNGYLNYWLGSAMGPVALYEVQGATGDASFITNYPYFYDYGGVRPVITVSKSDKITLVSAE